MRESIVRGWPQAIAAMRVLNTIEACLGIACTLTFLLTIVGESGRNDAQTWLVILVWSSPAWLYFGLLYLASKNLLRPRNWARKLTIGLAAIAVLGGVLDVSRFLILAISGKVRSADLGPFAIGTILLLAVPVYDAWVISYLSRPDVRSLYLSPKSLAIG